jgi:ribosomal protein L29
MKIKELKNSENKALVKLLVETKAKLLKDRFAIASRESTTVSNIAKDRRLVAKINTILRERELFEAEKKVDKQIMAPKGDK